MLYTEGIRKIYDDYGFTHGASLDFCANIAREAGYELVLFNKDIYYLDKDGTNIKLPLTIEDFEVRSY